MPSNRNRNLKMSKAPLKSQAHQGTSLFTSPLFPIALPFMEHD